MNASAFQWRTDIKGIKMVSLTCWSIVIYFLGLVVWSYVFGRCNMDTDRYVVAFAWPILVVVILVMLPVEVAMEIGRRRNQRLEKRTRG